MIGRLLSMAFGMCAFVPASRAADLYWCNGCTPEEERAMLARIDHGEQWKEVYVGDLQTRTLNKYGVARSWGQTERYDVRRRRTDPVVMSAFLQLMHFHDTVPSGWKKAYALRIVDPADPASVYVDRSLPVLDYPMPSITVRDVLEDPRQQRFFEDYLQADVQRRIPLDIGFTRRSLGELKPRDQAQSPAIEVSVRFMDGSRITSILDVAEGSSMKLDKASARDAQDRAVSATDVSPPGSEDRRESSGTPEDGLASTHF